MKNAIKYKIKKYFYLNKNRKRGVHKTKRSLKMNIKEFFYPSIGFKAWVRYIFLSLNRKQASSHSLALGLALGVFVSFTPFLGFHSVLAMLLAYFLSASLISSVVGTLIGNPWTFPLIWHWSLKIGNLILYQQHPPSMKLHGGIKLYISSENFMHYWENYIYPMTIGGIPLGLITAIFIYFILKYQIDKYRAIRKAILAKRKAEIRAKKIKALKQTFSLGGKKYKKRRKKR